MTRIEKALYDSLSPRKRAEVDAHLDNLEIASNQCLFCGELIPEDQDFCSRRCEDEFIGRDELMTREPVEPDDDKLRDEEIERKLDGER